LNQEELRQLKLLKRERGKDILKKQLVYILTIFFAFEVYHYAQNMVLFGWESRDTYSSGHSAVYLGIWLYALTTMYLCNSDSRKEYDYFHKFSLTHTIFASLYSFVYTPKKLKNIVLPIALVMLMVGLCEGMFNLAYYLTLVPNNQIRFALAYSGIVAYGTLALLLMCVFVTIWFKIWRALNFTWFVISLIVFAEYLVIWMVLGFPITINATIGMTEWYNNYWVNAVEIFSWYVYLIPAFVAFLLGSKNYNYEHSILYQKIHKGK
jgi:hypothetical protein